MTVVCMCTCVSMMVSVGVYCRLTQGFWLLVSYATALTGGCPLHWQGTQVAVWTYIQTRFREGRLRTDTPEERWKKCYPGTLQSCMQQVNESVYVRLSMCVSLTVSEVECVCALTVRKVCKLPHTDGENTCVTFQPLYLR
jgi:hypothetical protein